MTRSLIALFGIALVTGPALVGQSTHETSGRLKPGSTSLQGVWQAVEVKFTGPGARTIAIPEPRPNLMIISARHYSRVVVEAEGPRPMIADVAKATGDELRAAWGPLGAEAGTYELSGDNLITMRPIAAKNPAAMAPGAFTTYSLKMEGNTIWVTQQRTQKGPIANPTTIKVVRVE